MNRALPIVVVAGLAVALSATSALAGRGGAGGFQGGPSPRVGGGPGGASPRVGHVSGLGNHGGSFSPPARLPAGHTPSFNAPSFSRPRTEFRPATTPHYVRPSNPVSRPTPGYRPEPGFRADVQPRPGPRPGNLGPRQDWARHDWYHGDWHGHWDHPWRRWPYGWIDAGVIWGLPAVTPWSWGYWPYYNPYYVAPIVIGGLTIDYSQPIAAAVPAEPPVGPGLAADEASQLLDAARDAFLHGNYPAALKQVDRAIAKNPADPLPHEFRALVCFALKRYKEAAAGAYAVLSAGPGWDWTTLSGFYTDVNIYTQQLRALEEYIKAHPREPDVRFLLAYHYLTCGYTRRRRAAIEGGRRAQSERPVVGPIAGFAYRAAGGGTGRSPTRSAGPAAGRRRPDGRLAGPATGRLDHLAPSDGRLDLRLAVHPPRPDPRPQRKLLLGRQPVGLQAGGAAVMVGQIALLADGRLNFKLVGGNPSDPGLTFSR